MTTPTKETPSTAHLDYVDNSSSESPERVSKWVYAAIFSMGLGVGCNYGVAGNMFPAVVDRIAGSFGADAVAIQSWISSSWLLAAAVAYVVGGRLADIFGKRPVIVIGNFIGLIGFIVAAFTTSFTVLIVALAINGAGSGCLAVAFAAAAELVPNRYRPVALGFIELSIAPTGYLGGSVIAHAIIENTGQWRWIPRIGIILSGISTVLVALTYWPPKTTMVQRRDGRTKWQEVMALDWVGVVLFSGGLASFLMGVVWTSGLYPAGDVHVVAPLTIGLVVIAAFGAWEYFVRKDEALIPHRLFAGKAVPMAAILVVKFVVATTFFSQIVLWPQAAALLYSDSYLEAGILGLPSGAGVLFGGVILSLFLEKIRYTHWQVRVGIVCQVAFTAALASLTPESKKTAIALQFFCTLPFIYMINLGYLTVQFLNDPADIALASGLSACVRLVGGAIGVAVYVSILASRIPAVIPPMIAEAAIVNGLPPTSIPALVGAILAHGDVLAVPGITPAIAAAAGAATKEGFTQIFRTIYLSSLGFGGIGIIASFFVVDVSSHFTNEVATHLEMDKSRETRVADVERNASVEDVKA